MSPFSKEMDAQDRMLTRGQATHENEERFSAIKRIGYLGPAGSYSEEAARQLPLALKTLYPLATIPDVLEAVQDGTVELGLIPIENSIEGSVTQALDWFIHEVNLIIQAEIVLPIHHGLYVHPDHQSISLGEITRVFSHPQAIAQSRLFLRRQLPDAEVELTTSTSEAMRLVSHAAEERWAAIGSNEAAKRYGLYRLHENVQDYETNATRFVVTARPNQEKAFLQPAQKTSVLVTLGEDFPGALHQVLACFSWRRINLSRIESRPTKRGLGSYHFFIDIERPGDDPLVQASLEEIRALGCSVRYLGSYPVLKTDLQMT